MRRCPGRRAWWVSIDLGAPAKAGNWRGEGRARRLRPASGRRQYLTVLEWLLDALTSPTAQERGGAQLAASISADALVVVLTPLLDARSAAMLAGLVRAGRFVVAVDTLPPGLA